MDKMNYKPPFNPYRDFERMIKSLNVWEAKLFVGSHHAASVSQKGGVSASKKGDVGYRFLFYPGGGRVRANNSALAEDSKRPWGRPLPPGGVVQP